MTDFRSDADGSASGQRAAESWLFSGDRGNYQVSDFLVDRPLTNSVNISSLGQQNVGLESNAQINSVVKTDGIMNWAIGKSVLTMGAIELPQF
ncbi:hypothetical protein CP500_008145 [Tychonema bourrellyi FEM_GT703]|uniref:Uncharacterized protein n=1 Tax=Tychonema bourrellyi FEM_GT703 TaxID=2040638 RepID=A0A2G4F2D5_9CYAN|nr:hypothetical protein CP500_008145 [Tychonema bourrellyi FEM_GT703]